MTKKTQKIFYNYNHPCVVAHDHYNYIPIACDVVAYNIIAISVSYMNLNGSPIRIYGD
jgi:hypothetical protein